MNNDDYNNIKMNNDDYNNEIDLFLSKIQNKYSGNAYQKDLNQLYDVGILVVNKNFDRKKIVKKIKKMIKERSKDPIKQVRDAKKVSLFEAFKQGIKDAQSDVYRLAYDNTNTYQYDIEKLTKRAHIDSVLDSSMR